MFLWCTNVHLLHPRLRLSHASVFSSQLSISHRNCPVYVEADGKRHVNGISVQRAPRMASVERWPLASSVSIEYKAQLAAAG